MKKLIEDWGMVSNATPYSAPESISFQLIGVVEGERVRTSAITGLEGQNVKTENSVYELGSPAIEYEKQFPGAKERLLETIRSKQ